MPGVPGLFIEEQKAGWKKIADAIHAQGGYAYMQLWYVSVRWISKKWADGRKALWTSQHPANDRHTNRQSLRSALG